MEDLSGFPCPAPQSGITWAEFIEQVSDAILPLRTEPPGGPFSHAAESLPNRMEVLGIAKQDWIVFEGMELTDLRRSEAKGRWGCALWS